MIDYTGKTKILVWDYADALKLFNIVDKKTKLSIKIYFYAKYPSRWSVNGR